MPTNSDEILRRSLFNALPESAVGGTDVSGYYVRRTDDSENDPVANLKQYIAWDDEEAGACYLFSGLRGSGKTTELNRLVGELRAEGAAAYYIAMPAST
ncbi:hypothetical protein [Accumulibacter sp.]|uniref:hypothetical protein n=1 Tax=Accumulibacter sp. TaxID=2053492 RepID=UPI0025F2F136|nr:hypothetical protein [Accumulibacter sp.]MCM8594189.1 hypothetical protein [Accumulibacter sp.]MCM8625751.1 hypothetical protein [Accumulibacter sp.]MDS4048332.1 hypothetical protein [Accumulibacter sp.]